MGRPGLRRIAYQGYPFLLVKVEASKGAVDNVLAKAYGKKIDLRTLGEMLVPVDKDREVRVGTSFSPSRWWELAARGEYSWPFSSLVEALGNARVLVLKWSPETRDTFLVYAGLGIVSEEARLRDGRIDKRAEPVAAALFLPLRPRRIVSMEQRDSSVFVFTGLPEARKVLLRYGFREVGRGVFTKVFRSRVELAGVVSEIEKALEGMGVPVFLLGDLDRVVKEYRVLARTV